MTDRKAAPAPGLLDRIFELRMLAAILFGVYGIVCLIVGIGFTTQAELAKSGGIPVNLLTGIGMLIAAVAFLVWALTKPLAPRAPATQEGDAEEGADRA